LVGRPRTSKKLRQPFRARGWWGGRAQVKSCGSPFVRGIASPQAIFQIDAAAHK